MIVSVPSTPMLSERNCFNRKESRAYSILRKFGHFIRYFSGNILAIIRPTFGAFGVWCVRAVSRYGVTLKVSSKYIFYFSNLQVIELI